MAVEIERQMTIVNSNKVIYGAVEDTAAAKIYVFGQPEDYTAQILHVTKINKTTFAEEAELLTAGGGSAVIDVVGGFLYVFRIRYIYKIALATFTLSDTLDLGAVYSNVDGKLVADLTAGKIYVVHSRLTGTYPTWTIWTQISEITLSSFTITDNIQHGFGSYGDGVQPRTLMIDPTEGKLHYVFVQPGPGGATSTLYLKRIALSTFTEEFQRQIGSGTPIWPVCGDVDNTLQKLFLQRTYNRHGRTDLAPYLDEVLYSTYDIDDTLDLADVGYYMVGSRDLVVDETNGLCIVAAESQANESQKLKIINSSTMLMEADTELVMNPHYVDGSNFLLYSSYINTLYEVDYTPDLQAPTGLTYECNSVEGKATISIDDNPSFEDYTEIWKATDVAGPYTKVATLYPGTTSWEDPDVQDSTDYYYYAVSFSSSQGYSDFTDILSVRCEWYPSEPCPPYKLTYSCVSPNQVRIDWEHTISTQCGIPGVSLTGFKVERKRDDESVFSQVGTSPAETNFYIDTIDPTHFYEYRVRGYNSNQDGGYSSELSIDCQSLSVPTSPILGLTNTDRDTVELLWTEPLGALDYVLERRISNVGGSWESLGLVLFSALPYVDTHTRRYSYEYRVKARNVYGYSDYSNIVSREYDTVVIQARYNGIHPYNPSKAIPIKYDGSTPPELLFGPKVFSIKVDSTEEEIENLVYYGTPLP